MGLIERILGRRPPVPEVMRQHVSADERVLAWARSTSGQIVATTQLGMHILGRDGHRMIGWHQISKGVWRDGILTVTESAEVDDQQIADKEPWGLQFTEPGNVPVVLRERVEQSIVAARYCRISSGSVWLIGRKIPGQNGLHWQYRPDPEVDPHDLQTHAEIAQLIQLERTAHEPEDI